VDRVPGGGEQAAGDQVHAVLLDELPDLGHPRLRVALVVLDDQLDRPARRLSAHYVLTAEPIVQGHGTISEVGTSQRYWPGRAPQAEKR
jgi:hypothetical protein